MLYLSVTNKLFLIKITAKRFGTALLKKNNDKFEHKASTANYTT